LFRASLSGHKKIITHVQGESGWNKMLDETSGTRKECSSVREKSLSTKRALESSNENVGELVDQSLESANIALCGWMLEYGSG